MTVSELSIIVPVLNEAAVIEASLTALAPYRERGVELIVVDGGSSDDTCARGAPSPITFASLRLGRAIQMNAGRAVARGNILLFLHADTRLPDNADPLVLDDLKRLSRVMGPVRHAVRRTWPFMCDCFHDEFAFAIDWSCNRGSGPVCDLCGVRYRRWFPLDRANGRRRPDYETQASWPSALLASTRYHFRPSMANARHIAHDFPDVAVAAGILFWC